MSTTQKLDNPYLDKYNAIVKNHENEYTTFNEFSSRRELTKKYAWAIPNREAVEIIASYSPIVEIGGGTGYWAWLIEQAGGDIITYDIDPPESQFIEVREGDQSIASKHTDRSLMLCWPPYGSGMAYSSLCEYSGSTLIYIGEGMEGCTGDKKFHRKLEKWDLEKTVSIPQWNGLHDRLYVYKR